MDAAWMRTRELFEACLALDPERRAARLAAAPPDVRTEVESLLELAAGECAHRYVPVSILAARPHGLTMRARDRLSGEASTLVLFRVAAERADAFAREVRRHVGTNGWRDAGLGPGSVGWIVAAEDAADPLAHCARDHPELAAAIVGLEPG